MDMEQRVAKQKVILLMQQGIPWREAVAATGSHISRSTAYRWRSRFCAQGEATFQDGRHGHLAKLREPVHAALEALCRQTPEMSSRQVQATLQHQFGISVSIGHLNRVRRQLGLDSRTARKEKKRSFFRLFRSAPGKMGPGDCSC